jgi:hypothetical protein
MVLGVIVTRRNICNMLSCTGEFAKLLKATVSFVISVRLSAWNNSAPTRLIFVKFDMVSIFRKSIENCAMRSITVVSTIQSENVYVEYMVKHNDFISFW